MPLPHRPGTVEVVVLDVEVVDDVLVELLVVDVLEVEVLLDVLVELVDDVLLDVAVLVEVVDVGAVPSISTEPMSQTAVVSPLPSLGRVTPRWSVLGGGQLRPASIAGLPATRMCVSVGPP